MTGHDKLREAIAAHKKSGCGCSCWDRAEAMLAAAESTLPKTKMVEVWRVEYATNGEPNIVSFLTENRARGWAQGTCSLPYVSNVHVTGPHQQEVPE